MWKKPSRYKAKLALAKKKNRKMPNRTKYADMNKIMTNSEIHFHNCLCDTAQKMKFSIKNFFMENLMENFIFLCSVNSETLQ